MTDDEYKALTERGAKAWAGVTDAEIVELRDGGIAGLEALRRDAERYRWLITCFLSSDFQYDDAIVCAKTAAEVSAVIDAAMAAGAGYEQHEGRV